MQQPPGDTDPEDSTVVESPADDGHTAGVGGVGGVGSSDNADVAHFRAYVKRDPYLLLPKATYFAVACAGAAIYPFLVLLLHERIGLQAADVGVVLGMAPFACVLTSGAWGALADRGHRRLVLLLALLGSLRPAG